MMNLSKSVFRFSRIITRVHCLIRALFIICAIKAVCSTTPEMLGRKPFGISFDEVVFL